MNAPPAFQFYVDDFLGGVQKFSDAEVGLYMRLLCAQWSEGGLLDDDDDLQSYGKGGTPLGRVKAKFEKGKDGILRNARLEKVRSEQDEYRMRKHSAGIAGANARWKQEKCDRNATAMPKQCQHDAKPMAEAMPKNGPPSPSPLQATKPTKLPTKLLGGKKEWADRLEACLDGQWPNDAGKWINRLRKHFGKTCRVIAELENAKKENRIGTTPAQYAEDLWKRFP